MVMKNNNTPERFRNRKEALLWLQRRGQISQGKFYQDCNAGLLTIYPDKSLSKFQVAEYADKVFGFARQEPPKKQVALKKQRSRLTDAGSSPDGQGDDMPGQEPTQGGGESPFEIIDVEACFNSPEHCIDEPETGRGKIGFCLALSFTFTGSVQEMAAALVNIPKDKISGEISGALVSLLGEGILKGGCHVQYQS